MKKKLYRSDKNKILAGVMGGLGEYFEIDPVVFRVVYIAFSVFSGVLPGVFGYILMMLVVPPRREDPVHAESKDADQSES